MQKGRIENPSFCFAGCFSGSLHHSGYLKIHS